MAKVCCYCRSATVEQEDTLRLQEERCLAEYRHRFEPDGLAWGGAYIDRGASSSLPLASRPSGLRLALALEGGDVVIITKLDRGFRDLRDLVSTLDDWGAKGVRLVVLDFGLDTGTPMGKTLVQALGAVAEFERARVSEHLREAFARRKRAGRPCSGYAPYGMKFGGPKGRRYLQRDDYTRKMGARIVEWIDQGWDVNAVYFHLLSQRVRTRLNKEWSPWSIVNAYRGEKLLQEKEAKEAAERAKKTKAAD